MTRLVPTLLARTSTLRGSLVLVVDGRPLLALHSKRHGEALVALARAAAGAASDASGRGRAVLEAFAEAHGRDLALYEVGLAARPGVRAWRVDLDAGRVEEA